MDEQKENVAVPADEGCSTQEVAPKVGMSEAEQAPPMSTLARERMIEIIANNKKIIEDSEKLLAVINADHTLDASFCRIFGIKPTPKIQ